uniref:START domain-containing protein n=1 Tax=Daucus carota subsp. sativus TaxID=79200 RepID=A0A175YMI6_DAUCS
MAKNEHFPATIDEMSSKEKHSEVETSHSREKALLESVVGPIEPDNPFIVEQASAAMEELLSMAQAGQPLWIPNTDNGIERLSKNEYLSIFPKGIELEPMEMKSEASRQSAIIFINHTKLVEILMDVKQWSTVFSGIVSRASTIDVVSNGMDGNYNGALQVVTWVEHVEVDDRNVHQLYKSLVNSGLAFGAKRWIITLYRQCARLLSFQSNNIHAEYVRVMLTPEGRKSMLKLAERMVLGYCNGVGVSTEHMWTMFCGEGATDAKIMTRKNTDDPRTPAGTVISAASSFWIPVPPKRVFDFLIDVRSRSKWDLLTKVGQVQPIVHIANGRDPSSRISLLCLHNPGKSNKYILQESCADPTASYVIYAPVDRISMNVVLSGGDPNYVDVLPWGFAILPDGPGKNLGGILEVGSGGSLLTVAFQIKIRSVPPENLTSGQVATINKLIQCTTKRIKNALVSDSNV